MTNKEQVLRRPSHQGPSSAEVAPLTDNWSLMSMINASEYLDGGIETPSALTFLPHPKPCLSFNPDDW